MEQIADATVEIAFNSLSIHLSVSPLGFVGGIWPVDGPLARYVNLRVAHAPGMPGTFSPPPLISDPDMHHSTCATHVPWCMPGSLTSGFLWSLWLGKRSRHSRCMRNPQFYVSGKRPIVYHLCKEEDNDSNVLAFMWGGGGVGGWSFNQFVHL